MFILSQTKKAHKKEAFLKLVYTELVEVLPLKDLFINKEIEFDYGLEELKVFNSILTKNTDQAGYL